MTNRVEPYVGPRPFTRKDQSIFFGRDREANDLLSLIIAHPVVLLYAQSGAGKTSLLNAKITPMLEERQSEVLGSARVNGELPKEIEATDIENIFLFNALVSLQKDKADPRYLNNLPLGKFLKLRPHPDRLEGLSYRRVIIFDQFEEIFTTLPERWRDREKFFDDVGLALEEDPRLRIVFAMREEYIANMDPFANTLPEKLRTRFRLERLREGSALQAVKKPLEATGRTFVAGAAEALVNNLLRVPIKSAIGTIDISGEFVEPVQLQVVCQKLWRSLPPDVHEIDQRYIEDYGDVDEALSTYYDDCIGIVAEQTGVKEGVLRAWFGGKLITSDGTRGTVYKDVQTTGGLPNQVVMLLEDLRMVRPEIRGGAPWYELTHDRFIGPILQSNERWFNQRIKSRMISQALETKAKEWQRSQRPPAGLLAGDELFEAEQWVTSPDAEDLTVSESLREFVQASRMDAERQRAEAQTRIATGLRRQRVVLALIVLIALAMAFYTFRAQRQESKARRQAEDAAYIERGIIAKSLAKQDDKQFDALLLGIKAVGPRLKEGAIPPNEAVEGLRAAVKAVGNQVWLRAVPGPIRDAIFSGDSRRLLTFAGSSLSVWDATTGELLFSKPAAQGREFLSGTFTPAGDAVLAHIQEVHESNESTKSGKAVVYLLQILDAQNGDELASLFRGEAHIAKVGFSKDGKRVAFIEGTRARVIDTDAKRSLLVRSWPADEARQIVLLPTGTHVFLRGNGKIGELWDVDTGKETATLDLGKSQSDDLLVTCSPDGKKLVTAWKSIKPNYILASFWDTDNGKLLIRTRVEFVSLEAMQFSPDGAKVLAVGMLNNFPDRREMLVSLDSSTGQETTYKPFFPRFGGISLNSDGRVLISPSTSYGMTGRFMIREYSDGGTFSTRYWDPRSGFLSERGADISVLDGFSGQELLQLSGSNFRLAKLSSDSHRLFFSRGDRVAQILELNRAPFQTDEMSINELLSVACQQMRFQAEYSDVKGFCESGSAKK